MARCLELLQQTKLVPALRYAELADSAIERLPPSQPLVILRRSFAVAVEAGAATALPKAIDSAVEVIVSGGGDSTSAARGLEELAEASSRFDPTGKFDELVSAAFSARLRDLTRRTNGDSNVNDFVAKGLKLLEAAAGGVRGPWGALIPAEFTEALSVG